MLKNEKEAVKIELTKKEYDTLLEMLYIATWVISAHDTEQKPEKRKYDDVEQKIMAQAKDFGMDKEIIYDKKLGKYFTTRDFEEKCHKKFIDEYEDESFWDELVNRLAERDLLDAHTEKQIIKMDVWDRIGKVDNLAEKYLEEFEENGVLNLRIGKE